MRRVEPRDLPAIEKALRWLQEHSGAPQMGLSDLPTAMTYIRQAAEDGHANMVGPYLLLTAVGCPWYMKDPILIEDLVLKVHAGPANINEVVAALEQLRERFQCVAAVVGDTQSGRMVPVYTSHGFKLMGQQLIKEYKHGISTQGLRRAGPD